METEMETDAAAAAADLSHLVIRPYAGEADLPDIVRVGNADMALDGVRERLTIDDVAPEYRHASDAFDASRDVLVAEIDGRVVGAVRVNWIDTTSGEREFRSGGSVAPEWRRKGIGRRLLHAAQAIMRERAAEHPTDRPLLMGMFVDGHQAGREALARTEGYAPARWFFEMERPRIDEDRPEIPPMPEGLELRPATRELAPAIWRADLEAFRDHWGGWDDSEASFLRWVESPEFQPELCVVAWDGDEVAGAVLNVIFAAENAELGLRRGWLESVFTRRPWRGRGLARALIARSIHLLAERGMDTAALGVDADNPSGALGLYESIGFVVAERGAAWQKPMEVPA